MSESLNIQKEPRSPPNYDRNEEREREVFETSSAQKNSRFFCPSSRGTRSKKGKPRVRFSRPKQQHLCASLTRSIQTPRGGEREREREEELIRLYRENFKPRGEETAFEI